MNERHIPAIQLLNKQLGHILKQIEMAERSIKTSKELREQLTTAADVYREAIQLLDKDTTFPGDSPNL